MIDLTYMENDGRTAQSYARWSDSKRTTEQSVMASHIPIQQAAVGGSGQQ